ITSALYIRILYFPWKEDHAEFLKIFKLSYLKERNFPKKIGKVAPNCQQALTREWSFSRSEESQRDKRVSLPRIKEKTPKVPRNATDTSRTALGAVLYRETKLDHWIYPEDSESDPDSSSPANSINAITTRSMVREVEKKDQAQVQPDGNQGQKSLTEETPSYFFSLSPRGFWNWNFLYFRPTSAIFLLG
uniref:Uncharacterized protein n=1 Tax=Romanomermis culicivorax TaxID=13658 RepID=A0A915INL0_ROMCU